MAEKHEFLTPVGRLVRGSVFHGKDTDADGKPLVIKNGPNAGKPRKDYFFGFAIAKNDPAWPQIYADFVRVARSQFPTLFDQQGNCLARDFSMKIVDGDSQMMNKKGHKPCDNEGYPGHWVLSFSTAIPFKVYKKNGGAYVEVTNPEECKTGYYIRVYAEIEPNGVDIQKTDRTQRAALRD